MTRPILQLVLPALIVSLGTAHTCHQDADSCEFWLRIDHRMTMVKGRIAVFPENGQLYSYDTVNTSAATPMDLSDVITADGWEGYRLVIVANNSLPGPPIEVYEGQTVVVHVKNALTSESVTIHWHGLHQTGTPWMDGVAFVNQCPIHPGSSFTYRFRAKPKGTFWYHSHVGSQRTMGLYGAFIIREKKPMEMKELIAVITDWNHWDSAEVHQQMLYGMYDHRVNLGSTDSLDGSHFSLFRYQSGLINGRLYDGNKHNGAPLHVFNVTAGEQYRFRWIAAGALFPFRISIDEHNLTIIASDGYDLKPKTVESLVINPGERYDFIITTDKPVGNYWVRAITLEVNVNHTAEAILRYDTADNMEPDSSKKACTQDDKCVVANCPFSYYPKEANTVCIRFDEFKALPDDDPAPTAPQEQLQERFINFAFPGRSWYPSSANGRSFVNPPVSAMTQPQELGKYRCGEECTEQTNCHCFGTMDLDHNKVYQIVFLNMGNGKGWAHPIHMHGHSFYVVKMGYGSYNETTGKIIGDNLDIDCRGGKERSMSFCNNATWSNSTWFGGNVPGLELMNPPRKDTIIVPSGGYVVVRIKADNPGTWFVHCHIDLHASDGMALVLNESFPHHPKPPKDFPRCGDFDYKKSNEKIKPNPEKENMKPAGKYALYLTPHTQIIKELLLAYRFNR
ncbi:hypothetical protein SNE40_008533 [Patella caerulea]|uniref:Laccase n=1 Tax=Patella caerulea TaxID=87958 RepID=A0AAN8K185_PATCE